jgi:hypothetical protein
MSAIAEPASPSAGRPAPKGAVPPLAYQIAAAASVVLCTTKITGGTVSWQVDEVWKASASGPSFKVGETLRLDTRMHELLGYRPANDQKAVLFFADGGLPAGRPLELLPVVDGAMTYSPHDASVQEKLALQQLKERVAGLAIPLKVSFIGLKSMPTIALAHNNLAPMLVLFDDHLVQRVIFRKPRKYSEIEYVEVSLTDTDNLDIAYADSLFTFSCKLVEKRDLTKVLQFLERKGIRLGERAQRLLRSP